MKIGAHYFIDFDDFNVASFRLEFVTPSYYKGKRRVQSD